MTMEHQPATRLQNGPNSRAGAPRVDKHQPIIIQNIELLTPSQIKFKRKSLSTANLFLSAAALSRQGRKGTESSTRPHSSHGNHFSSYSNTSTTSVQTLEFGRSSGGFDSREKTPLVANGASIKFRKHVTFADVSTDTQTDGNNYGNDDGSLSRVDLTQRTDAWATAQAVTDKTNETVSDSRYPGGHHKDNHYNVYGTNQPSDVSRPISHTGDKSLTTCLHKNTISDSCPNQKYEYAIPQDRRQDDSGSLHQRALSTPDKLHCNVDCNQRDREVTRGHFIFVDREVTQGGDKTCSLSDKQDLSDQKNLNSEKVDTASSDYENYVKNKRGESEQWYEREKSELRALFQSNEAPKHQSNRTFFRSKSNEPLSSQWGTSLTRHVNPTTTLVKSNPDMPSSLTIPHKVIKVKFLKDECQSHQKSGYHRFQDNTLLSDRDNSDLLGPDDDVDAIVQNNDVSPGYSTDQTNKMESVSVPRVNNTKVNSKTLDTSADPRPENLDRFKSQGEHNADFLMQQYSASGEKQPNHEPRNELEESKISTVLKHVDSDDKGLKNENVVLKTSNSRMFPLNSPRARDKERRLLSALPVRSRATGERATSSTRNVKEDEPLDKLLSAERFLLSLDKKMAERTWMNRRLEQLVINSTKFGSPRMLHERSRTTLS